MIAQGIPRRMCWKRLEGATKGKSSQDTAWVHDPKRPPGSGGAQPSAWVATCPSPGGWPVVRRQSFESRATCLGYVERPREAEEQLVRNAGEGDCSQYVVLPLYIGRRGGLRESAGLLLKSRERIRRTTLFRRENPSGTGIFCMRARASELWNLLQSVHLAGGEEEEDEEEEEDDEEEESAEVVRLALKPGLSHHVLGAALWGAELVDRCTQWQVACTK
eukprot:CAMPEP_0174889382 /NCGR_PEP_ID=MMETSP0167-20121228/4644_1 /TAXON_ID=38298 /ORGANISM="Rhodella maculata, Strain CCMP736" /LENGTH=218 /DNA_ID=CAMNT_0016126769 /DNA_START=119 /DNA_END=777 /DNA_ORIENTATION=-